MSDEFSGQGRPDGYDPDRFYLESTDSKGHSIAFRIRIPPDVARRIAEVVSDRSTPFRTTNDVIRTALVQYLNYMATSMVTNEHFAAFVERYTAQAAVESDLEEYKQHERSVETARKLVAITSNRPEAKRLLTNLAETLPPGIHRQQIESMIQQLDY